MYGFQGQRKLSGYLWSYKIGDPNFFEPIKSPLAYKEGFDGQKPKLALHTFQKHLAGAPGHHTGDPIIR